LLARRILLFSGGEFRDSGSNHQQSANRSISGQSQKASCPALLWSQRVAIRQISMKITLFFLF
jgi:hypothetical protein